MHCEVHFLVVILLICVLHTQISDAIPCDSCGNECANACGTKHFRTCCFNYLRKRTDPNAMKLISDKRLIDVIMLEGNAMYTLNGLSQANDQRLQKLAAATAQRRNATQNAILEVAAGLQQAPYYG